MAEKNVYVLNRVAAWLDAHDKCDDTNDIVLDALASETWYAFLTRVPLRGALVRAGLRCMKCVCSINWPVISTSFCSGHADELFGFKMLKRRILDALGVPLKTETYSRKFVYALLTTYLRCDLEPEPYQVILGLVLLHVIAVRFEQKYKRDWKMDEAADSVTTEIETYEEE